MSNKNLLVLLVLFVTPFSILHNSQIANSTDMDTDTDEDGLSDYEELYIYHTNPYRESTDGDRYDDGQEILGHSPSNLGEMGGDMPYYVQAPGDNVFVAAYPIIDIDISDEISVVLVQDICTEVRNISTYTQGYSVANTEGSSYSVGKAKTHTSQDWIETANYKEDAHNYEYHTDFITSEESGFYVAHTEGKSVSQEHGVSNYFESSFGFEIPFEVGIGVKLASIGFTPEFIWTQGNEEFSSFKNEIERSSAIQNYRGTTVSKGEGETIGRSHVIGTSVSHGQGEETSYSTTITRTTYHETTVENSHSIASGQEWATATTVNPSNAGRLRFTFYIENIGTDIVREVNDLRFNIFVGDNLPITYPALTEPAISFKNLIPRNRLQFSGEVPLTLREVKDIDEGKAIRIVIASYSYGQDQLFYENAWGGGVLVEIDDGVEDGDETLDRYMTYAKFDDNYLDVLKRLNSSVQIKESSNTRREVPLQLGENDTMISIMNKPVTEWSWWRIFLQKISENKSFSEEKVERKTRMLLVYDHDSDHDFYTDRSELHMGTNISDPRSHPSPMLIAGYHEERNGNFVGIRIKFSNIGDYVAYGIEARLIPVDNDTLVYDNLIGGGGSIGSGETFVPDDYFVYENTTENYEDPLILVLYNDPQGPQYFITPLKISDLNESIDDKFSEMIYEPRLTVETNSEYNYYEDNWITVDYFNPSEKTIKNATIYVHYINESGFLKDFINKTVNLFPGMNSFLYWWNPSEVLNKTEIGKDYKVVVSIADCQNGLIDDDYKKFKIVLNPSYPKLNNKLSDGYEKKNLTFDNAGDQIEYVKIPKNATVNSVRLNLKGYESGGSYPEDVGIDTGNKGTRDVELIGSIYGIKGNVNEMWDGDREEVVTFPFAGKQVKYITFPTNTTVTGATVNLTGFTSNVIVNTFNDSTTYKEVKFNSLTGGNKTYYIEVAKDSTVNEAKFNITGLWYERLNKTCLGNAFIGGAHNGTHSWWIQKIGDTRYVFTFNFNDFHNNCLTEIKNITLPDIGLNIYDIAINKSKSGGQDYIWVTNGSEYVTKVNAIDGSFVQSYNLGHTTAGLAHNGSHFFGTYPDWGSSTIYIYKETFSEVGSIPCLPTIVTIDINNNSMLLTSQVDRKFIRTNLTCGDVYYSDYDFGGESPLDNILGGIIIDQNTTIVGQKYYNLFDPSGPNPQKLFVLDLPSNVDVYIHENLKYDGSGDLNSEVEISNTTTFQNYIDNECVETTCKIPLVIHTDTIGIVKINDISVKYTSTPTDLTLDTGNDGNNDWNYLGKFTTSEIVDLNARTIQKYKDNSNCSGTKCDVPLVFYSSKAGSLKISDIDIEYGFNSINLNKTAVQDYLSTCTPDSQGYCEVPIKFHSKSSGTLEILDIKVLYSLPNNPPVIGGFSPACEEIVLDEGDNESFSVKALDPDMDTLNIEWYLDGKRVSSGETYVYRSDYSSSGSHNLTVMVSDGKANETNKWDITVNDVIVSKVYVYPPNRKSAAGLELFVDVKINTTEEVNSVRFDLYFDPIMLNATIIEEGDFMKKDSAPTYPVFNINNEIGKLTFTNIRRGLYKGVSGEGRLARVKFKAKVHGLTDLELKGVEIANKTPTLLPYLTGNGIVQIKILAGDINDDHIVNIQDLTSVGLAHKSRPGDPYWNEDADMNGDCIINVLDLAMVGLNYGRML